MIAPTPDPACEVDWDSVSHTTTVPHFLRRVDGNMHDPQDLNGQVHHDGVIWSRALWDIRNAIGHVKADTLILEGTCGFAPDASMPAAAYVTVNAAQQLYGKSVAKTVYSAFMRAAFCPSRRT